MNAPLCSCDTLHGCALLDVPPSQSLLLDRQAAALFCLFVDLCVEPFAFRCVQLSMCHVSCCLLSAAPTRFSPFDELGLCFLDHARHPAGAVGASGWAVGPIHAAMRVEMALLQRQHQLHVLELYHLQMSHYWLEQAKFWQVLSSAEATRLR